ncbi:non-ribosomal peptide synthetase [Synoicihabitans lomoniglobus]|uniref:Non-ribosomal peptide synthetase n=1 Tax=Synoicihabitans lomoniglobus TaxID=2909285 RepID=A0AAF0CI15_9BACT|nr:non-ribosomal peptide synthetase [Opitutaceae bacterium LMO-M01]
MADLATTRPFAGIERFGDRLALVSADGLTLSYRQFTAQADAWAAQLGTSRGLLVIEMCNALEPLLAWVGACRARHPTLLLAPGALDAEPRLREAFQPEWEFRREGSAWLLQPGLPPERAPASPHAELAMLLPTSGSTGVPKLVRLSAGNVVSNAEAIASYLQITREDRAITSLPPYYSYGMSVLTSHWMAGASIALTSHAVHEARFWTDFEMAGATSFAGVPLMYETLESLGMLERPIPGLRTLTQAGGRLDPARVRRFAHWAQQQGARFYVMYGQTEASPRMTFLPPELAVSDPDCIGTPIPGGAVRLMDGAGREVTATGGAGELCYRGPNVMMGYAHDRRDLARGCEVGELWTGDIVERNEVGLLRIVGRASRFVKVAGIRIALDGLEADLRRTGVAARVAGSDEQIVIAVQGGGAVAAELRETWRRRLAIPATKLQVVAVAEFPALANGKTDYAAIAHAGGGGGRGPGDSLRAELTEILGRESLVLHETFVEAGGDSLNHVEGAMAVERFHGRRVPGWENLPIGALCHEDPDTSVGRGRDDPLVVARSVAIWLAMTAHVVFKFDLWRFVPGVLFVTAWATPLLLTVFGMGLARKFGRGDAPPTVRGVMRWCWPVALVYYVTIAITVAAQWIAQEMTTEHFLKALYFNADGVYAGIWMTYCWMVLLAPFIVVPLARWRLVGAILVLVVPWSLWPWLRSAPEVNYFWGHIAGWGSVTGPSVLHSTTMVVLGYMWGNARSAVGRLLWVCIPLTVAMFMMWWHVSTIGWEWFWQLVAFQEYRRYSHPMYFGFGVIGSVLAIGLSLVVTRWWRESTLRDVIYSFGRNPVFAYTFGNLILIFTPAWKLDLRGGLLFGVIYLLGLALITDDVARWEPRFFGKLSGGLRWLHLRLLQLGKPR